MKVRYDPAGVLADSNTWNVSVDPVPNADLVVSEVAGPSLVRPGDPIVISNTVDNPGFLDAGSFFLGLYLSVDATIDTGDMYLGYRYIESLAVSTSNQDDTVRHRTGVDIDRKLLPRFDSGYQ